MAMNAVNSITNVLPSFGAGMRPLPQMARPEAVPPQELKTTRPKDLSVVSFARHAPVSLEAPVGQILDASVNGNTPIGTLSQLRSDSPEDFLTLMTKILHNNGIGTNLARPYASYAASRISNAVTTTEAPFGSSLDVAA
jgi:hypothetical protein